MMSRKKFVELMQATQDQDDDVALAAIREANAMMKADNRTWKDFIEGRMPKEATPRSDSNYDDASVIEPMLEKLLSTVKEGSGFRSFVEDVNAFWERTGFLTGKQFDAIKKAVERANDR